MGVGNAAIQQLLEFREQRAVPILQRLRALAGGRPLQGSLGKAHRRTGWRTLQSGQGTGYEVTALAYGAMELRGGPRGRDIDPEEAGRILNAVLDGGINMIDTSIDYGVSEELIGRYISHRRNEYFLASKCGCWAGASEPPADTALTGGRFPHVFTRENIIAGVEQSLAADEHGPPGPRAVPLQPVAVSVLEQHGAVETLLDLQRRGQGPLSWACPARCPTCPTTLPWGCLTPSRFRTPQLSASTKKPWLQACRGGLRRGHPRRRRQGRPRGRRSRRQ